MKITIIGATQGIGKEVLKAAIKNNHQVTVLARNPSKINLSNIEVVQGDFLNFEDVKQAISKADVVVVAVGMKPTFKPVNLFSKGTKNIIEATKELNSSPLIIVVTGIGAGDSEGHGGFIYDKLFKPLLVDTIYQDKNRQEEILKKEYKNWVIVRPGFLTNGELTTKYKTITNLQNVTAKKISRKDVAHFILEQIINTTFLNQTPLLTY